MYRVIFLGNKKQSKNLSKSRQSSFCVANTCAMIKYSGFSSFKVNSICNAFQYMLKFQDTRVSDRYVCKQYNGKYLFLSRQTVHRLPKFNLTVTRRRIQ